MPTRRSQSRWDEPIPKETLTHRGNIPDDTDELIEDGLSSNVVLIDGIAAGDSVESIIFIILI